MKTKDLDALYLYREATDGGDPNMAHVSIATVQRLTTAGLVRSHTPEEKAAGLLRHRAITQVGRDVLAALTLGPVVP